MPDCWPAFLALSASSSIADFMIGNNDMQNRFKIASSAVKIGIGVLGYIIKKRFCKNLVSICRKLSVMPQRVLSLIGVVNFTMRNH